MARICIIGDTHIGNKNDSLVYHEFFQKYYNWLFPTLKEKGVTSIIQLGDVHDRRKFANFNTMTLANEYFFKPLSNDFYTTVIAGNHDVSYKNTNRVNSLDVLLSRYKLNLVTEHPTTIRIEGVDFDFYPWINAENYSECVQYAAKSKSKYACGHFEFANFAMYQGHMADSGMDHKIFDSYSCVFSGHYHTYSVRDNVIYTGTPYELNWSDFADQKYVFIFDTETQEIEPLPTPFTIHEKIVYDDKNETTTDLQNLDITGKYVKIVVVNKTNFYEYEKFITAVLAMGAAEVKIIEESIKQMIESVDESSLSFDDTPTLMNSYIDSLEEFDETKKDKLKTLLKQLYLEATAL